MPLLQRHCLKKKIKDFLSFVKILHIFGKIKRKGKNREKNNIGEILILKKLKKRQFNAAIPATFLFLNISKDFFVFVKNCTYFRKIKGKEKKKKYGKRPIF